MLAEELDGSEKATLYSWSGFTFPAKLAQLHPSEAQLLAMLLINEVPVLEPIKLMIIIYTKNWTLFANERKVSQSTNSIDPLK